MSSLEITCNSVLERRSPSLPRYAIVPATQLAPEVLGNPVTVEGTLNGFDLGPVKLRMRQDEQWEIDLAAALCAKAQVATGDPVTLHLRLASDEIPDELQALLDTEPLARTRWLELSDGEQRVLRDRVRSGRLPETRARRAREGLV